MKKALRVLLLLLVAFVGLLLIRTWTFPSLQPDVSETEPVVLDEAARPIEGQAAGDATWSARGGCFCTTRKSSFTHVGKTLIIA